MMVQIPEQFSPGATSTLKLDGRARNTEERRIMEQKRRPNWSSDNLSGCRFFMLKGAFDILALSSIAWEVMSEKMQESSSPPEKFISSESINVTNARCALEMGSLTSGFVAFLQELGKQVRHVTVGSIEAFVDGGNLQVSPVEEAVVARC